MRIVFIIMFFSDLAHFLLSCISLADDRHFYYFQCDSIFSSLVFASLFCFIFLFAFCLTFSSLLYASTFFSFLVCFLLSLAARYFHFLFSSCFLLLLVLHCSNYLLLFCALFYAASMIVCLLFAFFFNHVLSCNLLFSNLLLYLFLIQYCFILLLVLLW